jgi:hypothetical protein
VTTTVLLIELDAAQLDADLLASFVELLLQVARASTQPHPASLAGDARGDGDRPLHRATRRKCSLRARSRVWAGKAATSSKAETRREQVWFLKCLRGSGRARLLAACGVATLLLPSPLRSTTQATQHKAAHGLQVLQHTNSSPDRELRAMAAECLTELESHHPALLHQAVAHLFRCAPPLLSCTQADSEPQLCHPGGVGHWGVGGDLCAQHQNTYDSLLL